MQKNSVKLRVQTHFLLRVEKNKPKILHANFFKYPKRTKFVVNLYFNTDKSSLK